MLLFAHPSHIDPEVQQKLLILEEQEGAVNFKIGVLYALPGQRSDDEMFSNRAFKPTQTLLHHLGTAGQHALMHSYS